MGNSREYLIEELYQYGSDISSDTHLTTEELQTELDKYIKEEKLERDLSNILRDIKHTEFMSDEEGRCDSSLDHHSTEGAIQKIKKLFETNYNIGV